MIRAGVMLENSLFAEDSLKAVKIFYDRVRTIPEVLATLVTLGLNDRTRRCAAQPAYFAVREFKRRGEILSCLAELLLQESNTSLILESQYPSNVLLAQAASSLTQAGFEPVAGSREYLKNLLRHMRNLLATRLKTQQSAAIQIIIQEQLKSADFTQQIQQWLTQQLAKKLRAFLRKCSTLLTNRVKRIRTRQGPPRGQGQLDPLIQEILHTYGATLATWQRARRQWRNERGIALQNQLATLAVPTLVAKALTQAMAQFSARRLINGAFKPRPQRAWIGGDTFADFTAFLVTETLFHVERMLTPTFRADFLQFLHAQLLQLQARPYPWLKHPQFQKQTIPLGIDDERVYRLRIQRDPATETITAVHVFLSLYPGKRLQFHLKTLQRFAALVQEGYVPKRGCLTRKAGGGLILAVPFALEDSSRAVPQKGGEPPAYYTIAGLDVGLKTFGVVSIAHGTQDTDGRWQRVWGAYGEVARYFLDQKQLVGARTDWFLPTPSVPSRASEVFNVKRRLTNLLQRAWQYQQLTKRYANRHPRNYRAKQKYSRFRREGRRIWRKIHQHHAELAKQIAARLLAVLQHHHVEVLRVEDLSWAKHARKQEVGYFLATWQVHWFYAQVQDHLAAMAARVGIHVEWVNPRHTSTRCSRCGERGTRDKKKFTCPHCGFQLDADLNAARNIVVAPISLFATRTQGRGPFTPPQ
jgi:IS605 OrfB family transposase